MSGSTANAAAPTWCAPAPSSPSAALRRHPTASGTCRQAMLASDDPLLAAASRRADFYSLSGCRDLLFHVQEHRLNLPEIAAFIADAGLAFLGFDADTGAARKICRAVPAGRRQDRPRLLAPIRDREPGDLRRDVPVLGPEAVRPRDVPVAGRRCIFVYNRLRGASRVAIAGALRDSRTRNSRTPMPFCRLFPVGASLIVPVLTLLALAAPVGTGPPPRRAPRASRPRSSSCPASGTRGGCPSGPTSRAWALSAS